MCHTVPHLVRPDPRVRERIYTSLDVFRSRRMDHTVFHKWLIKQIKVFKIIRNAGTLSRMLLTFD